MSSQNGDTRDDNVRHFYNCALSRMFADGLITPFVPVLALSLGATKTLIGLLRAMPNLANLFSQIMWSNVIESVKQRKLFVIGGGLSWSLMWLPIAYVQSPVHLIILSTIQSALLAMSAPAWTVLLIQNSPGYRRGEISGRLNTYSGIGTFFGNMLGGYIINTWGFVPFLFYIIIFFGIMSRVLFSGIKELGSVSLSQDIGGVFEDYKKLGLRKNEELKKLIMAMMFLNFAVGLPGPLFSVYVVESLSGSALDVAIISAVGTLAAVFFYRSWGTLIDYLGRKTVMLSCLLPIAFIPFVYAVTNSVFWLFLYSAVGQLSWAGMNIAVFIYLSDALPKSRTSNYVAYYNLFTGLTMVVAPIIGGVLADMWSIRVVFLMSTFLRLMSYYFFDQMEEKTGFNPKGLAPVESTSEVVLVDRLTSFVSTYSLAIDGVRKEMRGRVKSISSYVRNGQRTRLMRRREAERKRKLRARQLEKKKALQKS